MKIQGLTIQGGSIKGLKLPAKSSAENNSKDNVLFYDDNVPEGGDMSLVVVTPVVPAPMIDDFFQRLSTNGNTAYALTLDGVVRAWGDNYYREVTDRPRDAGYKSVTGCHSDGALALDSEGNLIYWGKENTQLANPPLGQYEKVYAGGRGATALMLDADGNVSGFGYNSNGILTNFPAGPIKDLALGAYSGMRCIALKEDGTLVGWGGETDGLLAGIPSGTFKHVGTNGKTAVAVRSDGTLTAWGYDYTGIVSQCPTDGGYVSATLAYPSVGIALGLKADGSIVIWGKNTTNDGSVHTNVPYSDFLGIKLFETYGGLTGMGVREDGSLYAWGSNGSHNLVVNAPTGTIFA